MIKKQLINLLIYYYGGETANKTNLNTVTIINMQGEKQKEIPSLKKPPFSYGGFGLLFSAIIKDCPAIVIPPAPVPSAPSLAQGLKQNPESLLRYSAPAAYPVPLASVPSDTSAEHRKLSGRSIGRLYL